MDLPSLSDDLVITIKKSRLESWPTRSNWREIVQLRLRAWTRSTAAGHDLKAGAGPGAVDNMLNTLQCCQIQDSDPKKYVMLG